MFEHASIIVYLGLIALAAPALLLCVLGASSLLNRPLSEEATGKACQAANVTGLLATVVTLGLATALYAYVVGSVQTDIKSVLSFASLAQVGLIVAEIGLGFRYVALVHLLGNACLRTLQFIRAPTLLHDYHLLENAIGEHLPRRGGPLGLAPSGLRPWAYRFALERGYLDALLTECVVAPFVRLFRWCDGLERRWTDYLAGSASRESDLVQRKSGTIEELP